jgi:hypothetical protein
MDVWMDGWMYVRMCAYRAKNVFSPPGLGYIAHSVTQEEETAVKTETLPKLNL